MDLTPRPYLPPQPETAMNPFLVGKHKDLYPGYQLGEIKEFDLNPQLAKRMDYKDYLYTRSGLSKTRPRLSENEISTDINSQTRKKEKALWQHIFGDQSRYEDRKHASSKVQNVWRDGLLRLRRNIETRVRADIENRQADYDQRKSVINQELSTYDTYTKMFKPKGAKGLKVERSVKREDTSGKDYTVDLRDGVEIPGTQVFKDKAAPKKEKPAYKISTAFKLAEKINKRIKESGEAPKASEMKMLEIMLEDHPYKIEDVITQEAEKKGLFGTPGDTPVLSWLNDMLRPDVKETGQLELMPRTATPAARTEQIGDDEVAEILRKNGMTVTPETVARFRANNPGL